MPKLSIIIRSYNEEQHIGRLLHGIEMQGLPRKRRLAPTFRPIV